MMASPQDVACGCELAAHRSRLRFEVLRDPEGARERRLLRLGTAPPRTAPEVTLAAEQEGPPAPETHSGATGLSRSACPQHLPAAADRQPRDDSHVRLD